MVSEKEKNLMAPDQIRDGAVSGGPPGSEPRRQYYYMEKCRKFVEAAGERLGRPLYASVVTFGCQMNARDSEKLSGILRQMGYQETADENADFVLYNTCTVREHADQRVYGRLGHLGTLKKKNPDMIIAVCGCMMQEPEAVSRVRKSYPFVDIIFGTHNLFQLAELLWRRLAEQKRIVDVWQEPGGIVENLPAKRKYPFKSGVNIMFGCDNFCSYCIVPYVRGRERSRAPEDILGEIRRLTEDGVVEVMLLGQNVNSYGKNLVPSVTFARLLRQVSEVPGLERIRFMTSHPKDLSDDLIEAMAACPKVCRHLHLPVQSGSSRILEKMNRHYTKEQYLELVEKIRAAIPDISLTTDLIVGFPGETEEDFQETLDVVERVRFDSAFTFRFSAREGTPAARMEDRVPEETAKDRFNRLLQRVQEISAQVCGRDLHTVQKVLAEEPDDHLEGYLTGRMDNNTVVHFPGDPSLIGKIADVYLEESKGFYYMGRLA